MPQASASAGASTVTQAASPLLLMRRRTPFVLILPSTEPSTMPLAPGSMVKLPRRLPRTWSVQFLCTIVSLSTEPWTSDELLISSGPPSAPCSARAATADSNTGLPLPGIGPTVAQFRPARKLKGDVSPPSWMNHDRSWRTQRRAFSSFYDGDHLNPHSLRLASAPLP